MWIRQLSSSHGNAKLSRIRSLHVPTEYLISNFARFITLAITCTRTSHMAFFLQELQSTDFLNSHQHFHGSNFAMSYIRFYFIYIYTNRIQVERKFFFSFTRSIKLNMFTFIFFTLSGTQIRAYGSSTVLQLPPHLVTPTTNW